MLSPALETLAKPFFEEADISYDTSADGGALSVLLTSPDCNLQFAVIDYARLGMLSVECWNITRFEAIDSTATQLANDLNRKHPGKFTIDNKGGLDFCFELRVTEHTVPADFGEVFRRTVAIVHENYATIMKARWGAMNHNGTSKRKRQRKDPSKHDKDIAQLIEEALQQED